jgi:geranylgeranyl diphosphate synthase type II
LVLMAAEACGRDFKAALPAACAVEMVHAYSLIHDDLPCMDNDDFRRGRPTVHRAFSEAVAVLAGDALLTEAFQIVALSENLSDSQKVRLTTRLAQRIGKNGMVEGQAIDILSQKETLPSELLIIMDQKKTGDLFSCSLEFGAIIANAPSPIEEHLRIAGLHFGLAYQIRDDLEDASNSLASEKSSLVAIIGIESAKKIMQQSINAIHNHLSFLPEKGEAIKSLIKPYLNI